ncbi:MAG: HD-GYP domain-containing protein [Candidatus Omnitrophota bacterium]|jgi:putative nucleotidyltransferase with HDIG domain
MLNKLQTRKSIKTKILGIVLLSAFLVTISLGYLSLEFSKNRLVSMLGDSMKGMATTIAIFIKQNDVAILMKNGEKIKKKFLAEYDDKYSFSPSKIISSEITAEDKEVEEASRIYMKYTTLLHDIKTRNKMDSPVNVYVVANNRLNLILTSDPVLLTGAVYEIRPEAVDAMMTGSSRSTGIYEDKDGSWISAYASVPSLDSIDNNAVVEINYRVNSYLIRLRNELLIVLFICIAVFVGTAFMGDKMVTALVSAIKKLDAVAKELEKEKYDMVIDVKSDDEIGHLSKTFEGLRVSIKDKIGELKLSLVREKKAHLESIVALTNAMEMRDPYTKHHLNRVEEYALLIAKEMHLSHDDVHKLKYGCFLHDIGKIYIESALLQKVKLTPEDFEEIKKHSENGAKIIEGISFLSDVKDMVLYHQERYDGSGYPNGLKGNEIPLLARIVSVADAFDAMTTERPYKPKMSYKEAMDEVEKHAGTQFDPDVAKAFLRYRDVIEKIASKHFEHPFD